MWLLMVYEFQKENANLESRLSSSFDKPSVTERGRLVAHGASMAHCATTLHSEFQEVPVDHVDDCDIAGDKDETLSEVLAMCKTIWNGEVWLSRVKYALCVTFW